jgi:hypothetical protein
MGAVTLLKGSRQVWEDTHNKYAVEYYAWQAGDTGLPSAGATPTEYPPDVTGVADSNLRRRAASIKTSDNDTLPGLQFTTVTYAARKAYA